MEELPPLPPLPELPTQKEEKQITEGIPSATAPAIQKPPEEKITIRSLRSDVGSLEVTGGVSPVAEKMQLDFVETKNQIAGVIVPQKKAGASGGLLWVIGSVIGVGILSAIGYYVVYPMFFKVKETPPVVVERAPERPRLAHHSLFVKLPTTLATVTIKARNASAIQGALTVAAGEGIAKGGVKEITIEDENGPLRFGEFIESLLPDVSHRTLEAVLEDDFTSFLSYDDNGVWPGYVAKLKSDAVIADVQKTLAVLEGVDLSPLYIEDPGVQAIFQTGPVKGTLVRYSVFTTKGAAFYYAVIGDYAIVATSLESFKTAVALLGL